MNKRLIKLIIGLVVIGLLIGAYFLISSMDDTAEGESSDPAEEKITVYDVSPEDITAISYVNEKGNVSYVKADGEWASADDPELPLLPSFVESMVESVASVNALRDITDEGGNEADYGFEEPTLTLKIIDKEGKETDFTVGVLNTMTNGYYLKHNDRLYIIDPSLVDSCNYTLYDSLPTTDFKSITPENITAVTIDGTPREGEDLETLKTSYSSIVRGGVENYKDKEKYGFDGNEHTVEVTYKETADVTDESGNVTSSVDTENTYTFTFAEKDDLYYMMLPDDNMIYLATGLDSFN